jgi:hypothetical protein
MYVGYFDEVKADREQGRDNYLVTGLIIPMDQIGIIEGQMTDLAVELFGSRELIREAAQFPKLAAAHPAAAARCFD